MLRYTSVVDEALKTEVKPVLGRFIEKVLGENWYETMGREIFSDYSDFSRVDALIRQGYRAVDAMDLTALLYVMYPYQNEDDLEDAVQGLMCTMQIQTALQEWQIRRLKQIRYIRNLSAHEIPEQGFPVTVENINSGLQEKQWLNKLEEIMRILEPSFTLTTYQEELRQKVFAGGGDSYEGSLFIDIADEVRADFNRRTNAEFSKAPIKAPIKGAAPWARYPVDLKDLPWPSDEIAKAEAAKQETQKAAKQENPAFGQRNVDVETVLNKGVTKLINRFGKRK